MHTQYLHIHTHSHIHLHNHIQNCKRAHTIHTIKHIFFYLPQLLGKVLFQLFVLHFSIIHFFSTKNKESEAPTDLHKDELLLFLALILPLLTLGVAKAVPGVTRAWQGSQQRPLHNVPERNEW